MVNFFGSQERFFRVVVVGFGLSGFYVIGVFFKFEYEVEVDLFDWLLIFFGFVCGGVVLDYQKIKNVIWVYDKMVVYEKFCFFGNVQVGCDVLVEELFEYYDQVVFVVGNEFDCVMGILGEDFDGVYFVIEFVGWYNGYFDFQDCFFGFDSVMCVGVVGNGNVVMDVICILVQLFDDFVVIDIIDMVFEVLCNSSVCEIYIFGCCGFVQVVFLIKEIKEIGEFEMVMLCIDLEVVDFDEFSSSWFEMQLKSLMRNVDYFKEKVGVELGDGCNVYCKFFVLLVEFLGEDGKFKVVKIQYNEFYVFDDGIFCLCGIDYYEEIEFDFVFKVVGYCGLLFEGVFFYECWGIFYNDEGCIIDGEGGVVILCFYVVGWVKCGLSGFIGMNGLDLQVMVVKMFEDFDLIVDQVGIDCGVLLIVLLFESCGVDWVIYEDWQKFDVEEVCCGEVKGKVCEKFMDVVLMMSVFGEFCG